MLFTVQASKFRYHMPIIGKTEVHYIFKKLWKACFESYALVLKEANISHDENAAEGCRQNNTEAPKIYVILAKRIQTQANQTTDDDVLVILFFLKSRNFVNFFPFIAYKHRLEISEIQNFGLKVRKFRNFWNVDTGFRIILYL